jgi:hypothetical protein
MVELYCAPFVDLIDRLRLVPGIFIQNRTPEGQQLGFTDLDGLLRETRPAPSAEE